MAQIGGWNVLGSATNLPAIAEKVGVAAKQHIIYRLDASFSAAPAAPVLVSLVCPDVSPNTVLWSGYVSTATPWPITFSEGLPVPAGQGVEVVLGAGGSAVIGRVNLFGTTR